MGDLSHDVSPGIPLLGDRLSHSALLGKAFAHLPGDFDGRAAGAKIPTDHAKLKYLHKLGN
jgi:hypothetical protein